MKTPARPSKLNSKLEDASIQQALSLFNELVLSASILEIEPLRFTPSGIPAVNSRLEHVSELSEAGQTRQVKAVVKSVALGTVAEQLARQDIGSHWNFKGFLATPRGTKHVVFHIQEFVKP